MLIGLKKRKKTIHNPAGRGSSRLIWFAALFIWACAGPNGSGRLDKSYRKYGKTEQQPLKLRERRAAPIPAPTAANIFIIKGASK